MKRIIIIAALFIAAATGARAQLITVIHNPLVIWRLSDNKSVNFVEMTEGYVEKVRSVIEKGRRYGK